MGDASPAALPPLCRMLGGAALGGVDDLAGKHRVAAGGEAGFVRELEEGGEGVLGEMGFEEIEMNAGLVEAQACTFGSVRRRKGPSAWAAGRRRGRVQAAWVMTVVYRVGSVGSCPVSAPDPLGGAFLPLPGIAHIHANAPTSLRLQQAPPLGEIIAEVYDEALAPAGFTVRAILAAAGCSSAGPARSPHSARRPAMTAPP